MENKEEKAKKDAVRIKEEEVKEKRLGNTFVRMYKKGRTGSEEQGWITKQG